jgi:asparagine synthase (glutamine-hydrolysing)
MCGVTGFWAMAADIDEERLRRTVAVMSDSLLHRGPDSGGHWADPRTGVALGHRRLAIIDLTAAGHQPMESPDGRFVISYNGEVYNFAELRTELEADGDSFKGDSDTEVILAACSRWGVHAAVSRFIGMFAFALWDARERRLHLVRDRLGIKPLYWSLCDGLLLFGSELKALRAHPQCPKEVDRIGLASFMRHNYVPSPLTIYTGVHKLRPGHVITVVSDGDVRVECYWDALEVAQRGLGERAQLDERAGLDALEPLLMDAVRRRMVADVPLGAFLSGGIDSSLVVALMQAQSSRAVRTFSIGFSEAEFNEANHAKEVARHLGTDHTELYVDPAHALEVIPNLPDWYDEPFADSSQVPTFLVSELTRKHVTVSLSGDGGDELFAGYNRYLHAVSIMDSVAPLPAWLRRGSASLLSAVPAPAWDLAFRAIPGRWRPRHAGDKVHKVAAMLRQTREKVYLGLISHWQDPAQVVLGGDEAHGVLWDTAVSRRFQDPVEHMQFLDTVTYLPDDILTKVDRASMAVSLEARVPLIDHRLVELSWRLPANMKIRAGVSKWALREVLYKHVPRALIDRPKMGFGVPIDHWLRGPLREWAEELLQPRALEEDGYFNAAPIREKWDQHQSGSQNWQYLLWDVLMFQAWKRRWT